MLQYLHIGPFLSIPLFNLLIGCGMVCGMLFLQREKHFFVLSEEKKHIIHVGLLLSIGIGFIGAFFFDGVTQGTYFNFDNISANGLTFFGGFIFGIIFLFVYLYLKRMPVINTLGILTPSFCIAHSLGRIGCFLAGCCFGSRTDSPFGIVFPEGSLPFNHYHTSIHIHPTQLYESFFVFILFLFVYKVPLQKRFYFYIVPYCIFRFFIEFIRADNRGSILGQTYLSPSQLISVLIPLSVLSYILFYKRKNVVSQL